MKDNSIHCPKLTESEVRKIKAMLRLGCKQGAIAAEFSVSQTAVSFIANGKTWRNVP